MSQSPTALPERPRLACQRIRDDLVTLLGPELISLWVFGAVTQPDRPKHLGDVDTYGVLTHAPSHDVCSAIDQLHARTAREFGIEWDCWYIVQQDARSATPPRHALSPNLVDESWALHRAHWLEGAYVWLHGARPEDLVPVPSWAQLVVALRSELNFIDQLLLSGTVGAAEMAYCVCNSCRILHSLSFRNVVVTKRAAALWATNDGPVSWRQPIEAALRLYDGEETSEDSSILMSNGPLIVEAARNAHY